MVMLSWQFKCLIYSYMIYTLHMVVNPISKLNPILARTCAVINNIDWLNAVYIRVNIFIVGCNCKFYGELHKHVGTVKQHVGHHSTAIPN